MILPGYQSRRYISLVIKQERYFLEYLRRNYISWATRAKRYFPEIIEQEVRFLRHKRRSDTYWDTSAGEIFHRSRNDIRAGMILEQKLYFFSLDTCTGVIFTWIL